MSNEGIGEIFEWDFIYLKFFSFALLGLKEIPSSKLSSASTTLL